ncbi:MAG: hypothetical protein GXO34_01745 [Deltaproteobacteria bacterium]|nr:hypothetical protein [Deltaproteobacteria bacterium]
MATKRMIEKERWNGKWLGLAVVAGFVWLLLGGAPAQAADLELGFKAADGRMIFTIPYPAEAPEVNALFHDRGRRVELALPAYEARGGKSGLHSIDDDWISGFGLEKRAEGWRWFLEKRDTGLKVRPLLALERHGSKLQVVLLKDYRHWQPPVSSPVPAAGDSVKTSGKLARIQALLSQSGDKASAGPQTVGKVEQPSLLAAGLRSLAALVVLCLVIFGLAALLKRYRRGRGVLGSGRMVRVLGVENLVGRHQVALFEVAGEVLVVGLSGERMTLLATIDDPARLEELTLLQSDDRNEGRFQGRLQGLLNSVAGRSEPEKSAAVEESGLEDVVYQRPVARVCSREDEELPENYREVVSQIKDRLRKGNQR